MALKTLSKRAPFKKAARKVFVDYPQEGEHIPLGSYSIRVGAASAEIAEIAVNGKAWNKCRPAEGYYWFDWSPKKPGPARIVARIKSLKGKVSRSIERRCVVDKNN